MLQVTAYYTISAATSMKFKSLIHNRTITKWFSFYEKHILDFTTMFCGTALFYNSMLWFSAFDLSLKQVVETCAFMSFYVFWQVYPVNYFAAEIRKGTIHFWCPHGRDVEVKREEGWSLEFFHVCFAMHHRSIAQFCGRRDRRSKIFSYFADVINVWVIHLWRLQNMTTFWPQIRCRFFYRFFLSVISDFTSKWH